MTISINDSELGLRSGTFELTPSLKRLGLQSFDVRQEEIVLSLLDGKDVLALTPNIEKGICYQLVAVARKGTVLVVGEITAFLRKEAAMLQSRGIEVSILNGMDSLEQTCSVLEKLKSGPTVLYIAPSLLKIPNLFEGLRTKDISLLCMLDIHRLSIWNAHHTFEFQTFASFRKLFKHVPLLALAGITDVATREDISLQLGMQNAKVIAYGFDRPNIRLTVEDHFESKVRLIQFIRAGYRGSAGIIYCKNAARAQETTAWLINTGLTAGTYLGGANEPCQTSLSKFESGANNILVTTLSNQVPTDKLDIRFVAHLDMPANLESYYEQVAQAGGDGNKSEAWIAYSPNFALRWRRQIENNSNPINELALQKLESVVAFCETIECRRKALLAHLGENAGAQCGKCDLCSSPAPRWNGTLHARRALAAVYRTHQRFGVTHLIDVLVGKRTEAIKRHAHDQIKSFGIGTGTNRRVWQSIYRQLVALGHLKNDATGFGAVSLTESGVAAIKGDLQIFFRGELKINNLRKPCTRPIPSRFDPKRNQLMNALNERRAAIARAKGVRPEAIFRDSILFEMVRQRPRSVADLLRIEGITDQSLATYAEEFLEVIAMF
jgi:ATP-dependent DNA helicase RecQ